MPRPTKLTPEVHAAIVEMILHGSTKKDAAEAAGVHYDTFNEWMKKGEEAKKGMYSEFSEAIKRAEAQCSVNYDRVIQTAAAKGDWKAALEWKRRRRREDWGDNIDITSESKPLVVFDYEKLIAGIASRSTTDNNSPSQNQDNQHGQTVGQNDDGGDTGD